MTDWRLILESEDSSSYIKLVLPCVIGRGDKVDVKMADPAVSNHHCRVVIDAGECWIHDLGSTNGTWVNRQRINKRALHPGDQIRFGQHDYRVKEIEPGVQLQSLWISKLPPGWERRGNAAITWADHKASLLVASDELEGDQSLNFYIDQQKNFLEQLTQDIKLQDTESPKWIGLREMCSVRWRYHLNGNNEVNQIQHYGRQSNCIHIVTQTFLQQTLFSELVIEVDARTTE